MLRLCPALIGLGRNRWRTSRRWINYGHDLHSEMMFGSDKVSISEYDEGGFVINDINLRGAVAVFSNIAMLWKPLRFREITKESMQIFTVTEPPIELLLVGCGERIQHDLDPDVREYLRMHGIVVECLDSANASATFNILNAEDRRVAAALLPCEPIARVVT
uniref:NADH dehydrogenase [ubiquinone] 1 alpha subcomplex assembly factor 3 n=1 Tax=Albugo laibachii Nc14 TaxID=890382 RepID=F0WYN3_9STRA|nr:conserved hypothetical protein [Albugo laibachii Nc14]|eukprot:CCA26592.1 conserved hypothetical protein [Albugo laibachii Nc14]